MDPGPQVPDPVDEEPAEPPPPEPEPFRVSLSTTEVHRITTVTVTGALPNADLVVAWSLTPGESCPPQLEGGCLDLALDGPQLVGVPTTTDENGQVTYQARVPEGWWVGDGAQLLVQAAALTADGAYASSEVLEVSFEVTPRDCGWAEELNPNLSPETLEDLSSWLVCAPALDDGSCEQLDFIEDPWRPIELFSEVLGEPLPPQWSVVPFCEETAFDECCWLMVADDLSQGGGGYYGYLGRPFVVEEGARTAETRGAQGWAELGWAEALPLTAAGLDEALRETVASRWAAIGAAEHASIASFARFHLELLALGAPASLLEAASGALRDEIAHAKLAYSVASAFAGRPVGPGSLPIDRALDRSSDPAHVLVAAILEGCIGETLSAAQVQRDASLVADPALASALAKVADDEARHAELSWAFVRWLLQVRPDLRPLAAATFDRFTLPERPAASEPDLSRFGLSSERAQHDVAERVLREVIRPCADALLGREIAA